MNKKKVATVIVVDKDNKFLILKRSKTSPGSGLWNFPGGSVEENETYEQAGARELNEEAGLVVDPNEIKYIGTLESKYLYVRFFITSKFSGEVTLNKESDDYAWIKLSEVDKYRFVGNGGSLIDEIAFEIGKFIYGA